VAVGVERERVEESNATALQYPRCYSATDSVHRLGLQGREREPAAGRSPTAGQEGRFFLLNSCLIRLICLLSLYRKDFLTYKQGLLDP
jgi:hypothetical protein